MSDPTYDLFISYAGADQEWVEGFLIDALRNAGVHCYSEASFALGAPRLTAFEDGVKHSRRTVLVISMAYLADGFGEFTALLAQSYGLQEGTWPVIPLLLEQVVLPPRLAALTALNAFDPDARSEAIERLCGEVGRPVPGATAAPPCPYPGMAPFTEGDSRRFFGRTVEIGALVGQLRLERFLTLIGPSGIGKSSLVFAGLVPALRVSELFGAGEWLVRTIRPGEQPLGVLSDALVGLLTDPVGAVAAALERQSGAQRLLLIVDQFEELFNLAHGDSSRFCTLIQQLTAIPSCFIVLTARADFYAELMACPLWSAIQAHRFEIAPLGEAGLRDAILRPAENVGVYVEAALVERVVADAGSEPGVLPLVQETLVLLWERLERRFLPLRAYEMLVLPRHAYDVAGTARRTGLQVAIARRADAALSFLNSDEQTVARRVFLRLVQFGVGRADTRRQLAMRQLGSASGDAAQLDKVVHWLADQRILTLGGAERAEDATVDIAHEALIGGWPQLQAWIAERKDKEQTRRRLEDKAQEWVRLGRDVGGLLDRVELAEAERWMSSQDAEELGYDESLDALVKASGAALESADREREQLRQRDLDQARALAQAQRQRADDQARSAMRLRRYLVLVAALAFASVLAAGVAIYNGMQAAASRVLADGQTALAQQHLSRELAADAVSSVATDAQLGLLLGIQAVAVAGASTVQADEALGEVLMNSHVAFPLPRTAGPVYHAVFSPDGRLIATAGEDLTPQIADARTGALVSTLHDTLRGHRATVWSVAFSSDSRLVVTASGDGIARVWDPNDGRLLLLLSGHVGSIARASFSPDAKLILTAGDDGTARIWEAATGAPKFVLRHAERVFDAAFSPDGSLAVTASGDKTARLWDTTTGAQVALMDRSADRVFHAAFSPDGSLVATASADRLVRVAEVPTGKTISVLRGMDGDVSSVTFSASGALVLASSWDKTARVWAARSGEPMAVLNVGEIVHNAAFNSDSTLIVTASGNRVAQVWETRTGNPIAELTGHEGPVFDAEFSPDGQRVVTAGGDGTARMWNPSTDVPHLLIRAHNGPVVGLAVSPDGKALSTASRDGTARVWDLATGDRLGEVPANGDEVLSASFSRDGNWILTAGRDGAARGWRQTLSGAPQLIVQHGEPLITAEFTPDDHAVLTVSDRSIHLQSTEQPATPSWQLGQLGPISSASLSPDGTLVGVASGIVAQIYRLGDSQPIASLVGHSAIISSIRFSQDSHVALTASWDNTARVWDATSGAPISTMRGHAGLVFGATPSNDGRFVVTAGADGTARLWSAQTGQLLAVLRRHTDSASAAPLLSAIFSTDDRSIIVGSEDGTVAIFTCEVCATNDEVLALARAGVSRDLTEAERLRFPAVP